VIGSARTVKKLGAIVTVAASLLAGALVVADSFSRSAASASATTSERPDGERAALRAVLQRQLKAWERNDPDAFAALFTRRTQFVIGDGTLLRSRAELRAYMREGFEHFLKGARAEAPIIGIRFLAPDVAVVHTRGGLLLPGDAEVPAERRGIQVNVMTKRQGAWRIAVYQNTRICETPSSDPELVECGESSPGQPGR
jgi:uncharacterized protein (TIGR02246 family)